MARLSTLVLSLQKIYGKEFFKLSSGNKTCESSKSFLYQVLIINSSNLVVKLGSR